MDKLSQRPMKVMRFLTPQEAFLRTIVFSPLKLPLYCLIVQT